MLNRIYSMKALENNPYRLLGVYTNSPTKERLANHNRMKAFLKVGKTVAFPLDLSAQGLTPVDRTEATVAEAEAKLTLPKDQVHYAQFWFIKVGPLDEVAFNHLVAGNEDKAIEIWEKLKNVSSLQNRIVCHLMHKDYAKAVSCAEALYGNEELVEHFVTLVIGTGGNVDATALAFDFLDTLCEEIGSHVLLPLVTNEAWKKHLEEKAVKPLIENIQEAIEVAKKSEGKGAEARLEAGETLKSNTKEALIQLRGFLHETDLQYQMIADKLGLEILQCGIDYYNDSDNEEAPYKAITLVRYAQAVIVGKMAKDRCNKNLNIMSRYVNELPPIEVLSEHQAILNYLDAFSKKSKLIKHSIKLLKDCAPHVVAIKEVLGNKHPYYLKISTRIVNKALGNVIAEVNEAQNSEFFSVLRSALIKAWRTQLYMDKFDLEPEYEEGRYKESRDTLHNIIDRYGGFRVVGLLGGEYDSIRYYYKYGYGWCNNLEDDKVDLRTDSEFYHSCHELRDFKAYIKRFPQGQYLEGAKAKIEELTFEEAVTIGDLQRFIKEFPDSQFVAKAKEEIARLKKDVKAQGKMIAKSVPMFFAIFLVVALIFSGLFYYFGTIAFTIIIGLIFSIIAIAGFCSRNAKGIMVGLITGFIAYILFSTIFGAGL